MVDLPETIRTDRLLLRRPRPEDAGPLHRELTSDPEVSRFLTWPPHASVEETAGVLASIDDDWETGASATWVMCPADAPGEPVGMFSAWPTDHGVELGYTLVRRVWGEGRMTEAVRSVTDVLLDRVVRVWATCDVDNLASCRVLEKAGFQREGVLRKHVVHPNIDPDHRDSVLYAAVRD